MNLSKNGFSPCAEEVLELLLLVASPELNFVPGGYAADPLACVGGRRGSVSAATVTAVVAVVVELAAEMERGCECECEWDGNTGERGWMISSLGFSIASARGAFETGSCSEADPLVLCSGSSASASARSISKSLRAGGWCVLGSSREEPVGSRMFCSS